MFFRPVVYMELTRLGRLIRFVFVSLLLTWIGYWYFLPERPVAHASDQTDLEGLCRQAAEAIAADVKKSGGGIRNLTLGTFENDPDGKITERLHDALGSNGNFESRLRTTTKEALDKAGFEASDEGIPHRPKDGVKTGGGNEGVLVGKVMQYGSRDGNSILDLQLALAKVNSGAVDFARRYVFNNGSVANVSTKVRDTQPTSGWAFSWSELGKGLFRILAWMVVVLLLPVFSISFIRTMVAKKSNGANAMTLFIYVVVDAILAILAVGSGFLGTWTGGIIYLIALLMCSMYNLRIMTYAHRLETT